MSTIGSSAIANLIIRALGILSGFFLTIYILKQFGTDSLGYFSILTIYALIFVYLGKFGLDLSYVRIKAVSFKNFDKEYNDKKFQITSVIIISISFILTIVISISVILLKNKILYFQAYYLEILAASFTIIPYALSMLCAEGLRTEGNTTGYTFISGTSIPFFSLLFIAISSTVFDLSIRSSLVTSFVCSVFTTFIIGIILYKKNLKFYFPIKKDILDIIIFSIPFLLNSIVVLLLGWTDSVLLSIFNNQESVGEYNFYLRIANLVYAPVVISGALFTKRIIETLGEHTPKMNQQLLDMTRLSFALSIFVAFLCVILFPLLQPYIFTESREYPSALYWLIASQVLNALTGPKEMLLLLIGEEKVLLKALAIALVVNIILNGLLIPKYGILGASITNFVSMMLWNGIVVTYLYRKSNINLLRKW